MLTIWYICKYVIIPTETTYGGRSFYLMRELAKLGHKCIIIASDSNNIYKNLIIRKRYERYLIDDVEIWLLKTLKYNKARSLKRILSWLHFEWQLLRMPKSNLPRPNVIIVSSLSLLTIFNGMLLKRRFGVKLVFEIRDIWPLTIIEEGKISRYNPFVIFLSWVEKIGYKYADAIVGTMPNLKEHVAQVLGNYKTTYCIPMGVDENMITSIEELPRDYINKYIPEEKFIVAFAGLVGNVSALDTLMRCAEMMDQNEKIHFLIVGDGDKRDYYKKKYGHLKNVTFAARVPSSMVQSVLKRCDLLYFSVKKSKVWQYGLSLNKVIDYMLASKPIVASYSGYPSMINEAGCGCFIPAEDEKGLKLEIERLFNMSQEEREKIGARGRKWLLENRTYKKLAEDYLKILIGLS